MPDNTEGKNNVRLVAEQIMPDSTSARLARALGVNQRNIQKMLSGQSPASPRLKKFLEDQSYAILRRVAAEGSSDPDELHIDERIGDLVQEFRSRGAHDETIASYFAHYHRLLVDREIE